MSTDPSARVTVQLFGSLRLWVGAAEKFIGPRSQRQVVARLALSAGEVVSKAALVDVLWANNPPKTSLASLHNQVSRLRLSLGRVAIRSVPAGYVLEAASSDIDLRCFESLLLAATSQSASAAHGGHGDHVGGHEGRASQITTALAIWSGPPLQEFGDDEWTHSTIARLGELRHLAREQLAESLLWSGDANAAVITAGELCGDEPLSERAHILLGKGLAAQGRNAEAMRVLARFRQQLVSETGLEPSSAVRVAEQEILGRTDRGNQVRDNQIRDNQIRDNQIRDNQDHSSQDRSEPVWTAPLPVERTPLIGREEDVAELIDLISASAVVTVTGPGGVGKTRLAIRAAHQLQGEFNREVYFIDLSTADPTDVDSLLCESIGAAGGFDTVIELLRLRRALLVLDCCERLLGPVAHAVSALTSACPSVRVLTTSREMLQVTGEAVFRVNPLGSAAVELFESRVRLVRRGFRITAANRKVVDEICAAVDNLPLAIELVASHCAHLTLGEVAERLTEPLDLLDSDMRDTPSRHHGMRQAMDWSWDMLDPLERVLFSRLSMFVGGCGAEAADAVCRFGALAEADVETLLAALVRRSLLVAELDGDRVRYRLLDTMRAYGAERLDEFAETSIVRERYADWVDRILTQIGPLVASLREQEVTQWLEREASTVRLHLNWAVANGETDLALKFLRPVVATDRHRFVIEGSWPYERIPAWREHPDAAYIWLFVALTSSDPDTTRDAAMACLRTPGFPDNCASAALAEAVRTASHWRRKEPGCLAELRRLVETRDDALLLFRLAWAEYWDTAANGDDVILALEVLVARAIDVGSPTMLALARLFRFLNGAGPQTESEILKIRSVFVEMRFRFFVSFCDRATAKLRSDVDRIRDAITVMTLGDEVAGSALWVRYFGEERAELLARHGRNVVAATLLGAVEATGSSRRHRTSTFTDGQAFTADRARLQFPIEFAQGTTMRLDELSVLVRSELESILAATEASREVSAL